MVSPQTSTPELASGVPLGDRGIVQEEVTTIASYPAGLLGRYSDPAHFWGPVIAGTLFVLSLFSLSYFLMLGCHVGVTASGMLSLGWGAAVWIVITACIAYYCGGMIANSFSRPFLMGSGWLKGATVWGLSVPLAAVIGAIVLGGSGLFGLVTLPHVAETVANAGGNAAQVANNLQPHPGVNFGFIWTAFITLILGLIFSILGSSTVPAGTVASIENRVNG